MASEKAQLAKLVLDVHADVEDLAARRRALFAFNVWDKEAPFYGTDMAKALRDEDPPFWAAQEVYAVLYDRVR